MRCTNDEFENTKMPPDCTAARQVKSSAKLHSMANTMNHPTPTRANKSLDKAPITDKLDIRWSSTS